MTRNRNEELHNRLRKDYPVFNYESYRLVTRGNDLILEFQFNIDGKYHFNPKTEIKAGKLIGNLAVCVEKHRSLFENIAFHIGMIEVISYWKATCSPVINIKPARLTGEQINWWKKLYFNGLGEFFYLNTIEAREESFVQIESSGTETFNLQPFHGEGNYLVPIGGGKDSAVTLSLLMENDKPVIPLIMNPRGATIDTIIASGLSMDDVVIINRMFDPALLELNNQGFLNGHTPFSAMLAFYTLMCSVITGYRNIALSNESSASESTIPGTKINHQYSKSLEFETDFRNYYTKYITGGINYFSFLRPLSELQIARIFAELTRYHDVFRSCNAGSKTNSWCGKCPKCMFTHILISAFTNIQEADRIIGSPMLNDQNMEQIFDELAGFSEIKPFECIGTTAEVKQALQMITEKLKSEPLPFLLNRFEKLNPQNTIAPDFSYLETPHFVSSELVNILKNKLL